MVKYSKKEKGVCQVTIRKVSVPKIKVFVSSFPCKIFLFIIFIYCCLGIRVFVYDVTEFLIFTVPLMIL